MPHRKTTTHTSNSAQADIGLMLASPMAAQMTSLRLMADASRTMASCWPAAWLVASSPFFWAPPLWVLAMMTASTADPHGGVAGSVTDGAATGSRTVTGRHAR